MWKQGLNAEHKTGVPNAGGGYNGFGPPEASNPFVASGKKKGSAVQHRDFQQFCKKLHLNGVNGTTIEFEGKKMVLQ